MSEEGYKAVGEIKNQWIETKDEYLDMALNVIDNLKIKSKQYKEVIEKVREYVNNHIHQETFTGYMDSYELKKLLQILDKTKEKEH